MNRRLASAGLTMLAVATSMAAAAGCSSSTKPAAVATGSAPTSVLPNTSTRPPTTPTTAARQLPTVPNCGGGAYEPKTLLIVCGSGSTMATGVSWRSWGSSTAFGSGTVQLTVNGHPASAPATLLLSEVVNGPVGPQFSRLTVTWAGTAPDGKQQDVYSLPLSG
jgi:hypothetical protein